MNKNFVLFFLIISFCLSSCGTHSRQLEITPAMIDGMNAYADRTDRVFPEGENVARTCADKPAVIYWNKELKAYAVACVMPNGYGIVTFDKNQTLIATFSLSQENYALFLESGWKAK